MSDSSLKGFYHRSDARLCSVEDTRQRQSLPSTVFRGYPAELVAELCGVSVDTAKRWKSGECAPSRPALRLFELHRKYKILSSPAWDGWEIKGGVLVDPEGNETTQGQLRAYYFVYQLVAELAKDSPEAWERLQELQRLAAG